MVFHVGEKYIYRFPDDADSNIIPNSKNLSWGKLKAHQIHVCLFAKTTLDVSYLHGCALYLNPPSKGFSIVSLGVKDKLSFFRI